jgi:Met-zincin/Domain of unknown function (DUF5117)
MIRIHPALILSVLIPMAFPVLADGQEPKKDDVKKEDTQKDPKIGAYESAVKDLKKIEGSVNLYRRGKELLLELPEDKLDKILLIQASLSTGLDGGFLSPGMPVGDTPVDAFKLSRNEGTVVLIRPNISNRWTKGDPLAVGAARNFPEATLGTFRIEQEHPIRKLLLVNVTSLFYGDIFHLSEMVSGALGGPYQIERDKSGVDSVAGYPENTIVQMKLLYSNPRGGESNPLAALLGIGSSNTLEDDRSAPLRVTYNLWFRKDNGYRPRQADPRIGYFTQDFFSVDRFLAEDRTEQYINRWNLLKRDPLAKVSAPVRPITFTIDPSIPEIYRQSVKEGVLRWNKAFESAGFKNAIAVQDVPASDTNYDHSDGRYNVIRMIVGPGAPFAAISLPRTDPFTGEILNASISLDANIIRDLQFEHQRNLSSLSAGTTNTRKAAMAILQRDPERDVSDDFTVFASAEEKLAARLQKRMQPFGWAKYKCDFSSELAQDGAIEWYALVASTAGPINKEEYVKRFLADCVSHEVGHCLGLRHNFAGSTNLTTTDLANDDLTSKVGLSASVMDYTPTNVQAILRGKGNYFMPTVGAYDLWAIQYGYEPIDGANTGEKYALAKIASQSGLPGHAFETDEDADRSDPYAVRFDLGRDPLNYSEKVLLSLVKAREYAIHNLPKPGESYSKRTAVIVSSIVRSFREGRIAARFVGGIAGAKNFKGDVDERPTLQPISPEIQRQAVSQIVHHFFAPDAFALPSSVFSTLSQAENRPGWTAPLRDIIGAYQSSLLALLIGSSTTDRISENTYKANGYTLDEHYGTIIGAIFNEVGRNQSITPLRRDLQRFALAGLMTEATAPQGAIGEDVRMITSDVLRRLDARLKASNLRSAQLDSTTRVHLRDMQETLDRFRSRNMITTR